ncbi:AMP-binding protein [Chelatococcus reniformis]|uniref:Acyl-CoA synthetase n=1 Tax=Chelatococcus reniformis TaxID=1494448 RepID=A0A916U359_9HYPH|nr:AMP-binding protein [Chelatococcus reniformis]GGC58782.1 acyl-CoA synthetase [Chelatococcus reniformis]
MNASAQIVVAGDTSVARQTLLDRGRRAATALDRIGVREDDSVALLVRNDPVYFEIFQAANALGAYVVPLNWHNTVDELDYILSDAAPRVLIGESDLIARARAAIEGRVPAFATGEGNAEPAAPAQPWSAFRDRHAPWSGAARAARGTMIYTSGTTGRPKGVCRGPMTPAQIQANARLLQSIYGTEPGMRALVCGPLYHASPGAFARQAFQHAALTVLQTTFDAEDLLRTIETHRISHLTMVPTMFVRLLRLPESVRCGYDMSSLRWATHTGAPCPPEVKQAMIDWWGPVIHETYGATETGPAVGCTSAEWLAHRGSVGQPMAGTTLRIYGEGARALGTGEVGEIYLRTQAYADFAYHGLPHERAQVERDGLITCGDVGYLDADGFLYICDRKRDMVISGGVNIYPAEIENVLVTCPGVRDCAVFGVPDAEFGEALVAAVEAEPGAPPTVDRMVAHLGERLARYKIPKVFEFHPSLPREASGKLLKRKVRQAYLDRLSAAAA